ncbi:TIGR02594 family protein, partial [Sinorhizobium meliloti]
AGRSYHVGVLSQRSKSTARLIGGNQSGRVQLSYFSRAQVVAVRR